ncbi:hypothetical protein [Frigoriglobus tundricola]|uniref:Uncharacterized protein n=1 Tax=Frigoriglobus tundricola TaxID=2774151 RepID=A0A6M5YPX6_9BACT|nr:hypothetical protein [Frigoriglobus tundricola]QJW95554.1 hypothetical protein FTUN_3104 [Frigoriglobus tundricola]
MSTDERDRNERWVRRMAALEDGCETTTGGAVPFFARLFPVPDTGNLTPAQAEAALSAWRAKVHAAMAGFQNPTPGPGGPAQPAAPVPAPEAPVA